MGVGDEPDPRFTLANERTYLAWVRTGLALTAGGVALEAFSLHIHPRWRIAASMLLLAAGAATPVLAWFTWRRTERALRLGQPASFTDDGLAADDRSGSSRPRVGRVCQSAGMTRSVVSTTSLPVTAPTGTGPWRSYFVW
ncbi:YidH family protein [Terrabacter sp. GCM10028922]|uniref:YidH family protein n=1 Tax=Terrabacter sp. GCM10028922 TaxID=3273428 RepID=UPI00362391BF